MSLRAAKPVLILFLLFLCWQHFGMLWHMVVTMSNGWVLGDWLINFQDGGFKRRGLSGSFFFFLQDITKLDLRHLVWGFIALIYILFYFFFYLILRKKQITFLYIILLLSPVTFLFYVYNPECVGRKEVLLFLLSALYIYMLDRGWVENKIMFYAFLVLVFTATFFHEVVFFFVPYFLFFTYCHNKLHKKTFAYQPVLMIFIATLVPMLIIVAAGGELNQGQSLAIFQQRGLDERVMGGILMQSNLDVLGSAKQWHYIGYVIPLILGLIPFILFLRNTKESAGIIYKVQKKSKKESVRVVNTQNIIIAVFVLIVFSIPLFLSAIDWGRWISIHFIMWMITFSIMLNDAPAASEEGKIAWLPTGEFSTNAFLVILGCLSYLFLWRMSQCCGLGIIADGKDLLFFHTYLSEYNVFPARNF